MRGRYIWRGRKKDRERKGERGREGETEGGESTAWFPANAATIPIAEWVCVRRERMRWRNRQSEREREIKREEDI